MNPGEQGGWLEMGGPERTLRIESPAVRVGLDAMFTGPQGGQATNDHIKSIGRELASNVSVLFATIGDGTTITPSTSIVDSLTLQDIRNAVALIP